MAINGLGDRERAIKDAEYALSILVRSGERQMTLDAMQEARDVQPYVVACFDGDDVRIELHLKTWEEVEAFKAFPGMWADDTGQWAHPKRAKIKVTIEPPE